MKSQYECPYNEGVLCSKNRICRKCGWNPEVDKARKKKLRGGLGKRGKR